MIPWIVVLAASGGTFALRASMLTVLTGRRMPPRMERLVGHVAPAAMGALLVSLLWPRHGGDARLSVAVLAALFVARRTRNANHALLVGFPLLWLLSAL